MTADLVATAERIGREVSAPVADEVDRDARFPKETIDALRGEGLLAALVPPSHGGPGVDLATVGRTVRALAHHCSSAAMVYAMHQIQVACIARHARTGHLDDYLRRIASTQPLLASATTELGVGGDTRTSLCAVEREGDRFRLDKQAPVISYGQFADAVLATARRTPDSPPSDQVQVVCEREGLTLEPRGQWDALGFRGTCSPGFRLLAEGPVEAILPTPFGEILARTMLPVSHLLWSSLWLGIAESAMAKARNFVQESARSKPGVVPPGATRVAEATAALQSFEGLVDNAARRLVDLGDAEPGPSDAVHFNTLKVAASTAVVDIVGAAMNILGMAGYRQDSPYSLGRLLRDAHGAAVMVNNDRIIANTASLVLLQRSR